MLFEFIRRNYSFACTFTSSYFLVILNIWPGHDWVGVQARLWGSLVINLHTFFILQIFCILCDPSSYSIFCSSMLTTSFPPQIWLQFKVVFLIFPGFTLSIFSHLKTNLEEKCTAPLSGRNLKMKYVRSFKKINKELKWWACQNAKLTV